MQTETQTQSLHQSTMTITKPMYTAEQAERRLQRIQTIVNSTSSDHSETHRLNTAVYLIRTVTIIYRRLDANRCQPKEISMLKELLKHCFNIRDDVVYLRRATGILQTDESFKHFLKEFAEYAQMLKSRFDIE